LDEGNETAWEIFIDSASQLRTAGMGSVVGFDYSSLPFLFAVYSVPESETWIMLKKLNVLFGIALKHWNKKTD
jgi:hypothetical protein